MAHGATVLSTFEPNNITHIVTCDRSVKIDQLLRIIGVETIDDIPTHIPVLRWDWVEESSKKRVLAPIQEFPAFKNRVTYPPDYVPPQAIETAPVASSSSRPRTTRPANTKERRPDPEDTSDSGDEKIS